MDSGGTFHSSSPLPEVTIERAVNRRWLGMDGVEWSGNVGRVALMLAFSEPWRQAATTTDHADCARSKTILCYRTEGASMTSHDTMKQRGPHLYSLVCAAKTEEASMIIRDPFKQGSSSVVRQSKLPWLFLILSNKDPVLLWDKESFDDYSWSPQKGTPRDILYDPSWSYQRPALYLRQLRWLFMIRSNKERPSSEGNRRLVLVPSNKDRPLIWKQGSFDDYSRYVDGWPTE